jgi:hypothetical protein
MNEYAELPTHEEMVAALEEALFFVPELATECDLILAELLRTNGVLDAALEERAKRLGCIVGLIRNGHSGWVQ